jgi:hypothetical protein
MSVLLVTDDADDDIQNYSLTNPKEDFYKQLKELEYDFSSSSSSSSSLVRSFSIVESTSSIIVQSNQHYRQHRRRRRCRPQQCVVQHLLTYMLTLLILTNHLHWPVIILSLSSIKLMSTQASIITTTIGTPTNPITTSKRPILTPSTTRFLFKEDEQQCLPINASQIDRICSKTCRARKTPFEKFEHVNSLIIDLHFLPFCANLFNQTIIKENFFNEVTETECRQHLQQLTDSDEEARIATESFAIYMESIDSASKENRYSIIIADCQVVLKKKQLLFFDEIFFFSSYFRKLIEHGLVQSIFHIFIRIISYRLAKRSVMKLSVSVLHFDPVIVNHYLLDNHYFFAMVITILREEYLKTHTSVIDDLDCHTSLFY